MFFELWIAEFAPGKEQAAIDLQKRWSAHAETKGLKPQRILRPEWGRTNRLYILAEYESRAQRDESWETLDEVDKGLMKELLEGGVYVPSGIEHYFFTEAT